MASDHLIVQNHHLRSHRINRRLTARVTPPASIALATLEVIESPIESCHDTTPIVTVAMRPQSRELRVLYRFILRNHSMRDMCVLLVYDHPTNGVC